MKPAPVVLALSLAANAALVAVFVFPRSPAEPTPSLDHSGSTRPIAAPASGLTSLAPPNTDLWSSLQTDDLKTLAARLRAAGFPDHAIRGAIQALINERHQARLDDAHRRYERPFWKATDRAADNSLGREQRSLQAERSRLERETLGSLKLNEDRYADLRRRYGELPPEKIAQLERLNADYDDLDLEIRIATNGIVLAEDREKLALLDREKRKDLAALLSPEELAEHDVRSSPLISRLSSTFGAFRATESEFRSILDVYRAQESALYPYSRLPPSSAADRDARAEAQGAAQAELDSQLRATLGEQRYAEFTRAQSREFQLLATLAVRADLPPQAALQAYHFRDHLSQESNRIFDDTTLDVPQKRVALQTLAQTTRAQLAATLGTAGETYLKTATWLDEVERGGAITFHAAGGRRLRGLPNPGAGRSGASTQIAPLPAQR